VARPVDEAFRAHLRKALDTAMRTSKQSAPYHTALRNFINGNVQEDALDAMLGVYYDECEKLEEQGGKDAVYISGSTFEQLVLLRIEASLFYDPWLQEALKLVKKPMPPGDPTDRFRKRFDRLEKADPVSASRIRGTLDLRMKLKRENLTFFEILIDIYAQKHGLPPDDDQQLFVLDPAPDPALEKEYDGKVARLFYAVLTQKDPEAAEKALYDFADWASQVNDMARAFQILKWCRDRVLRLRAKPHQLHVWLFNEIYLTSIQRAVITATKSGYLKVQTGFLRVEEIDVLIEPLVTSYYFSDYADRLYPFTDGGARAAGLNFNGLSAFHIYLLIFAESRDIRLQSAKDRDEVAERIMADPSLVARTLWISGDLAAAARSVKAGAKMGNVGTLVLVEASNAMNVSIEHFPHQLFYVHPSVAGKWLDQHLIDKLLEGTEHLLVLIPALFDLLQYTHVFITGGISGLIEELIEDQVAELAGNLVYEYTGNEKLQMAVGALANPSAILVPSRAIARTAAKGGAKSVRKVKAVWKSRGSIVREAKVVKPRKPAPAKAGHLPKVPKANKPKRFTPEQEQILAHEAELKKLNKKKVRLGNKEGKSFENLSGMEAVKKLFRDTIAQIPRLAQHWPEHLKKRYVDEIKAAIETGLQNNLKLWNQVKKKLDKNILDQDVLNSLPQALRQKIRKIVVDRWDSIRNAFWKSVQADKDLVEELEEIGIKFEGKSAGSAPDMKLADIKMKCSLDHVKRKVENPLEAFSADNLRILTGRDNSVLKEGIVRNIRKTTGLDLDTYSANKSWGRDKVPKEYKEGLAETLDAAPEEGDIWRSFEDPDLPPKPKP
jgi:hypothetical protein